VSSACISVLLCKSCGWQGRLLLQLQKAQPRVLRAAWQLAVKAVAVAVCPVAAVLGALPAVWHGEKSHAALEEFEKCPKEVNQGKALVRVLL